MVRIHETAEGIFTRGKLHQFQMVAGLSPRSPGLTAALQHPEAHYVFEEPRGSVDATFVGEVVAERFRGDDRSVQFCSQQWPRTRTWKCCCRARNNCRYRKVLVIGWQL